MALQAAHIQAIPPTPTQAPPPSEHNSTYGLAQVRKMNNTIHWINHYPADNPADNPADSVICFVNTHPLASDSSGGVSTSSSLQTTGPWTLKPAFFMTPYMTQVLRLHINICNRNKLLCRSVYDSAFSLIELVYLTVWFAFGPDMSSQKAKVLIDIISDTVWPWYVLYWCCLFHSAYETYIFMWWACFNPDPGEISCIVRMYRWLYPQLHRH